MNIKKFIEKRLKWSLETFGKDLQIEKICNHLRQEIDEAENDPMEIYEWVDIIFLALDGAGRMGFTADNILNAMWGKHRINSNRRWKKGNGDLPHSHVE